MRSRRSGEAADSGRLRDRIALGFHGPDIAARGRRRKITMDRAPPSGRRLMPSGSRPPRCCGRAPRTRWRRCRAGRAPAPAIIASGLSCSTKRSGITSARILEAAVEGAGYRRGRTAPGCRSRRRRLPQRDDDLVVAGEIEDQLRVERLGEARVGHRGRQAVGRRAPPLPSARRRAACRRKGSRSWNPRARCGRGRSAGFRRVSAVRCRCPRRADSGTRRASSMATAVATMCTSSASSAGAMTIMPGRAARDSRYRTSRHGSGRRRRRSRRGRSRSAPAASGSRRRGRSGRSRAAGRSNRSRRTASKPSEASPAAKVTACCSAMPTSKVRVGNAWPNRSSPVPDGMAAVIATTLSSRSRFLDQAFGEDAGIGGRVRRSPWPARR